MNHKRIPFVHRFLPRAVEQGEKPVLLEAWDDSDSGRFMRWDPVEDVRYAVRLDDPGPAGAHTVWMANLLAYRALVFFPCAAANHLAASGWSGDRRARTFTWPVWKPPLSADTIRSLLRHPAFGETSLAAYRQEFRARGVEALFRSRRIEVGRGGNRKYNFSPAVAL